MAAGRTATTVDPIVTDMGTTRLRQQFMIDHPREKVWLVLRDPAKVAGLIPGVTLDTVSETLVTGRMALRLGPIKATFKGSGTVERADSDYRQIITGRGDDRSSGSIAEGQIDCALQGVEQSVPEATKVEINLSYSLRGPLAQFGRSNLIRDFVAQIGETFAENLDALLSGERSPIAPAAEFAPLSLLWKAIVRAFNAHFTRLFGQRNKWDN